MHNKMPTTWKNESMLWALFRIKMYLDLFHQSIDFLRTHFCNGVKRGREHVALQAIEQLAGSGIACEREGGAMERATHLSRPPRR